MNINISENLKRLRMKQNITQDALAEKLGVSSQAVSKWERGDGYPDITTIPLIANYFCVTIDELFGYHGEREKQIKEHVCRIRAMNIENNGKDVCIDECLKLARAAAAEYPGNSEVLLCLADVLYNTGYVRKGEHHLTDKEGFDVYDVALHRTYAEWQEAIKLYEGLVVTMAEGDLRFQAIRKLISLYANTGENEKAIKAAENYSCLEDCRELVYANASDGKKRAEYLGDVILKLTSVCATQMVQTYMSVGNNYSLETAIQIIHNAINLYDLVCTDGEYGLYNFDLRNLYLYLSVHQWKDGDHDGAFVSLYKALDRGRAFESYNGKSDITFTSPLLQQVKINLKGYNCLCAVRNLPDDWPWWCVPNFKNEMAEMQADPRFAEWVKMTQE